MTFSDKTSVVGREAASILELDLDGCARRYGISPCVATLALSNLIIRSEEFDNVAHGKALLTVSPNTGLGDTGATTADKLVETATTGAHQIFSSISVVSGEQYTTSFFVRPGERTQVAAILFSNTAFGGTRSVEFDIDSLTVIGDSGGAIDSFGIRLANNGLVRVWITATAQATETANIPHIRLIKSGAGSYLGIVGEGLEVWGWQTRPGPLPGRYQVTTSAAVDGMGAIDDLCFNTFGTCQDTPNYLKEVRTLRFCDRVVRPTGLVDAYPAITSVQYTSTQLKPGGKFSVRGKVVITLQDFVHNDSGVDHYQAERTYDQETQGTFFGRLKERNKFYVGRPMRVLEGYLDAPFSLANFRTREYIIENITGPTADGKVTIEGKDVLALARDDRAKAPTASTHTLRSAMDSSQTTMLPQVAGGEAAAIVAGDKHVRIDDEILLVGSESPTDTVNVTRAQGGTDAKAHSLDATIQECLTFEDEPVIDVIDTLLTTFANIPASFIPTTDWEAEETESLAGYLMENIISVPTGVTKLLQEICEITLIDLWYSDVDQEIKLKLQTPYTSVTETWDDDDNFLENSIRVRDLNSARLSRILIYYGRRNFARDKTEPENYGFANFEIEADKESVNKYNDEKIRTIFSSWFDASNSVQVALTSQRLLLRFGITPVEITFDIDAKDVETLQIGDVYDVNTRVIQGDDGAPKITRFQITETKPKKIGSIYTYKSMAFFQDPTPESLIVSSNEVNFDLFVELGGPPGAVDVTVTVDTGVDIDATNGNPAFTTVGMHPDSSLQLNNNGEIRGYGGNGKRGGNITVNSLDASPFGCIFLTTDSDSGLSGQVGGDAIFTTIDITIDNTNGNVFAGAGGGGGGDSARVTNVGQGGGGGGGGLGTDTGNGGVGGDATEGIRECGAIILQDGLPGVVGSDTAAGAGGAAGGASAGAGGAGGADWGDDGFAGGSGGAAGGQGGFAVRLNGNTVIWEGGNNPTQVKGDVA